MAVKALMLRKKIDEKQKALTALRSKLEGLTEKKSELETRESDLEKAVEEASTDEERAVVEEAVTAFEADKEQLASEEAETTEAISDLETEIEELEKDLEDSEARTAIKAPGAEGAATSVQPTIISRREDHKMLKTRSLRSMSFEAREAFVAREDVQATLAQVRELISQKRTVSGANLTIGESILGLLRENVIDYSKLYSRVNYFSTNKDGRQIVQGVAPEAIWIECCDAIPELDISFGDVELDCYKVAGFFSVCNAAAEDSDIDLIDALSVALLTGLGKAIDKAILYGTGSKMPTGVVTAIAADADLDDTNLITIPSTDKGDDLFASLILAFANADGSYSRGAKTWVMNEKMYSTLLANAVKVDASGAIVAGVNGVMPVIGGDIIVLNSVPDNNIVAGYFDLYALLEKKGMTITTSEHAKFVEDKTVLKAVARMDGKPAIKAAFVAIGYGAAPAESVVFPTES